MNYIVLKTKVYICFYPSLDNWVSSWMGFFSRTKLHHCTVMLERDEKRIMLAYGKSDKAKIIDADSYNFHFHKPSHVIELGEAHVSVQQLCDFIKGKRINDVRGILFWWWIGRLIFPSLIPRTCGTLTCDLIKLFGFKIKEHVSPKTLYKELTNATDNHCWSGRSWQDYIS